MARSRIYDYVAPMILFDIDNNPQETFEKIQRIIKQFEGTHNFHNYSRGL